MAYEERTTEETPVKGEAKELTTDKSLADFKKAYKAKRKLIERQKDDFLFRLGKQWPKEKEDKLISQGINPVVDNRIQPNIFLITGLERQNRSEFKAFPDGEEDSLKAEIATALFKDSIKVSDFQYKASEAFEDGITCGESALELYLDNTYNMLNGKPCWKKIDSNMVFPQSGTKEYDWKDAKYIYKFTPNLSDDDLICLFPEKEDEILNYKGGKLNLSNIDGSESGVQHKDYPKSGDSDYDQENEGCKDLIERYYKKYVETTFIGDKETGQITQAESKEKAQEFINNFLAQVQQEQQIAEVDQIGQIIEAAAQQPMVDELGQPIPQPPIDNQPIIQPQSPDRYVLISRKVPEIWYFAQIPGMKTPLANERAWFYPKWKSWPIVPYYAHFSTAPITGDDAHLLIQGIVYGVKGVQQKHNSSETLKLMHLNSSQNSGWLNEEGAWVNENAVKDFGSRPGINLEYKKGYAKPERQFPMPLSQGHTQIANESAEAIKAILGINADLLAVQEGSSQSGKAIALRQRQGLLMVQKLFDNLSRTKQICGKLSLSQMGEMYDTETAKKVLGEAFLTKNFPPPMQFEEDPLTGAPAIDPMTGQPKQSPMTDEAGNPMQYDKEMADLVIAEVLAGDLGQYDVTVGEAVASETMLLANSMELKDLAQTYPGLIPPDVLFEESTLNQSTKKRVLTAIQNAQARAVPTPINTPVSIAG